MFRKIDPSSSWSDGLYIGGRRPRLFVVRPDGIVFRFFGKAIPPLIAIVSENYTKSGKWSHSSFRFHAAGGVALVESLTQLHQIPFSSFSSWKEVVAEFSKVAGIDVDYDSAKAAIRDAYTGASGGVSDGVLAMEEREAVVASIDASSKSKVALIGDSFSIGMVASFPASIGAEEVSRDVAREIALDAESAVRDPAIARMFSRILDHDVASVRDACVTLYKGDRILVGVLMGGPPEGPFGVAPGAYVKWIIVAVK